MTQELPSSDQLTDMLLAHADRAETLATSYLEAWSQARTARINRDLTRADVVAGAYADGGVDGKNEAQRAAQLDTIVLGSVRLKAYEESLRAAEGAVKHAEVYMESARVYRATLHDLVDLRVAELGIVAATAPRASRPRKKKEVAIEKALD